MENKYKNPTKIMNCHKKRKPYKLDTTVLVNQLQIDYKHYKQEPAKYPYKN